MYILNSYIMPNILIVTCGGIISCFFCYFFAKQKDKIFHWAIYVLFMLLTLLVTVGAGLELLTSSKDFPDIKWGIHITIGIIMILILPEVCILLFSPRSVFFDDRLVEEYDMFFNTSIDLFCIARFNGFFDKINASWEHVLGYTAEELCSVRFIELVHPDDKRKTLEAFTRIIDGEPLLHFENRYIAKDGTVRHLRWSAKANLQRKFCYAVARDITQEKQDSETIDRTKAQLKSIFQAFSDAIILRGPDKKIVMLNKKFMKMFGYKNSEVLGKTLTFISANDYSHEELERLEDDMFRHWNIDHQEVVYTRKDGSTFVCETVATTITSSSGDLVGYLTFLRDVSERKKAEEELKKAKEIAEQASLAKSQFLANMSHEIRTPMNGIMGTTGLLLETSLTKEQKECIDIIRISSDNLLTIINDILDFSKIEAGKMSLEVHDFDLLRCAEDAMDLFSSKAIENKITFRHKISADIPFYLRGDITRIRQVLVNLLSNAAKFTQNGRVELHIDLLERSEDYLRLRFAVKDEGIGIDEERLPHIFDPFLQAHSGKYQSGTGLGLSICKRLCEMMHGKIWCENNPNKGCTFYFTIQVKEAQNSSNDCWYLRKTFPDTLQVLYFDASKTFDNIYSRICTWNFQVVKVNSWEEALVAMKQKSIDISILIDGENRINIEDINASFPVVYLRNGKDEKYGNNYIYPLNLPIKHSNFFSLFFELCLHSKGKPRLFTTATTQDVNKNLGKLLPLRILIAEDNSVNQVIATRILQKMGYVADVAGNGLEVLGALDKKEYDLIFMDIRMPEMDGIETTKRIINSIKRRPTIIAVTANAMSGDREKYLELGMDDYISKPITLEGIQEVLYRWGRKTRRWKKMIRRENVVSLKIDSLLTLKDISVEAAEEVIKLYLEDSALYIEKIKHHLKDGNYETIESIAHSLKGASMSIGAIHMSEISHVIEQRAKENDTLPMESLVQDLQKEYNKVYHQISSFRDEYLRENTLVSDPD